jgi:hypothetical protein
MTKCIEVNNKVLTILREKLAEHDMDNMDDQTIYEIALDGCLGWNHIEKETVIEYFIDAYGEDQLQEIIEENS